MQTITRGQNTMPRLNDETKTAESPSLKRPNTDRRAAQMAETQAQSTSAIAASSSNLVGKAAQSLQSLDAQLSQFEDNYADSVVLRLAEVPNRINAKIAARLQPAAQADPLEALTVSVASWEIPDLSFNCPAIAPSTVMGALPM
jgi:hypothetical protein